MPRLLACVVCVILSGLTALPVRAHGLGIDARVRGGSLHLDAYFDDNSPVANAKARLLNQENQVLAEGMTDSEGRLVLAVPPAGTYRVEIRGEDGHFAQTTVLIPENSVAEDTLVSEGRTRADRTGARKWGTAVFGVAVIAAVTVVLNRLFKKSPNHFGPPPKPGV